jgi:hypothetical protein
MRHSPQLAKGLQAHDRGRQAGQGRHQAIMRKLIVLANTLLKHDRTFVPEHA